MYFLSNYSVLQKSLFFALLITAFFFGMLHLSESPGVWYDEGFYTQLALNAAHGDGFTLQTAPGVFESGGEVTVGFPLTAPVALSYFLFGADVFTGRMVMVIFIMLLAIVSFFLVRTVFGIWPALASLALLVSFPVLYGNGKSVLGEIPGLLFLITTLITLISLERNNWSGWWRYGLFGVCTGLAVVTKPIFILLLPALFFAFCIQRRAFFIEPQRILITGFAFAIPVTVWFLTQFTSADTLQNVVGFYINPYEITDTGSVVQTNILRFFTESTPLYLLVFISVWWGSWFVRWEKISIAEMVAVCFVGCNLLFYIQGPGWYRYFFPAQIVSLLFFTPSLFALVQSIATKILTVGRFSILTVSVCIAALVFLQLYQVGFSSFVASYYNKNTTATVTLYFDEQDTSKTLLLYDAPELVIFLKQREYYQYIEPHPNQRIGTRTLELLTERYFDEVIVPTRVFEDRPESFLGYGVQSVVKSYTVLEKL